MAKFRYGKELSHWVYIDPVEGFVDTMYGKMAIKVRSISKKSTESFTPDIAWESFCFNKWLKDRKIRHDIQRMIAKGEHEGYIIFEHEEDILMLRLLVDNKGRFGYDTVKSSAN